MPKVGAEAPILFTFNGKLDGAPQSTGKQTGYGQKGFGQILKQSTGKQPTEYVEPAVVPSSSDEWYTL
jgi:hypothetical protein